MAGQLCPQCRQDTFFEKPFGGQCTKCGFQMIVPPNEGKGGRGRICLNCGKSTVFNNKCRNCGATYKQ